MTKSTNKDTDGRTFWFLLVGFALLALVITWLLKGTDIALLNPQGVIAEEQYKLLLLTTGILLVIGLPTLIVFYFVAWKYRETNEKAEYNPKARHGKLFLVGMWAVPSVFMVVLTAIMWSATHRLEPQKAVASNIKPLTIQVVALPWKWLFIYPDQKIASVNFLQIPTDTPVQFQLTADKVPMSSFWIPHLSGQLYAMTGHINKLNIMATTPGDYPGSSAEINGAGFAGMKFVARAVPQQEFETWTGSISKSFTGLDTEQYEKLLKPSENHPYAYYSDPQDNLYDTITQKYMSSHDHQSGNAESNHSKGAH